MKLFASGSTITFLLVHITYETIVLTNTTSDSMFYSMHLAQLMHEQQVMYI